MHSFMQSELSEASGDLNLDPQSRCLSLAEKIISALNDPELVQRYFNLKTKLMGEQAVPSLSAREEVNTDKAYAFYQSLAEENEKLKDEIARLSASKPDFRDAPDNESIASKLRELQHSILPNHKLPPRGDAVEELDSLRKVVEAKLDSLAFVREKLRAQNQRLSNEFREIERTLNAKIESTREKEESERLEIERQEKDLAAELAEAQHGLNNAREALRGATEENTRLRRQHSDTAAVLEGIEAEETETEQRIEEMESESERYFEEIEHLKTELNKRNKELGTLQALQKFGVEGHGGETEIADEIRRLAKRAESLRTENAQMSFELKRLEKRQQSASGLALTSADAISLDENELAAQILKAKLQ